MSSKEDKERKLLNSDSASSFATAKTADSNFANTAERDLLNPRSEIFRSKLINDFHLLDSFDQKGGTNQVPKYTTDDILEFERRQTAINDPQSLVRFNVYNRQRKVESAEVRKRNRFKIQHSKRPPIDIWASWVVNSNFFQNVVVFFITANSIALGVQVDMQASNLPTQVQLKRILDIFDYVCLYVFVLEIVLKWAENFKRFWNSKWNVFDFIVTFASLIPELINLTTGGQVSTFKRQVKKLADTLRAFRILRSFKMILRFNKVKLLVLAATKAFQSMMFIIALLLIVMYIFATMGVIFFKNSYEMKSYKDEITRNMHYPESFLSLHNAMITMMQIFTLDRWMEVLNDLIGLAGVEDSIAHIYVILWVIFGGLIFKNVFTSVMVNCFKISRSQLFKEVAQEIKEVTEDMEREELGKEMNQEKLRRNSFAIIHRDDVSSAGELIPQITDVRRSSMDVSLAAIAQLKAAAHKSPPGIGILSSAMNVISAIGNPSETSMTWNAQRGRRSSSVQSLRPPGSTASVTVMANGSATPKNPSIAPVPRRRMSLLETCYVAETEGLNKAKDISRKSSQFPSCHELVQAYSQMEQREAEAGDKWMEVIKRYLAVLEKESGTYFWYQDTLFHYYVLMESLQENLAERAAITGLLEKFVVSMMDVDM